MPRRTVPVIAVLAAMALVAGGACSPGAAPTARVTERRVTAPAGPASAAVASTKPTLAAGNAALACPDPTIAPELSPAFATESLGGNDGHDIASTWVDALVRLYAGDAAADPCAMFTGSGLQSARAVDPRLRAALERVQTVDAEPELRIAFEGSYDLRVQPPTVRMNVIFDLPAGTRVTDIATGLATTADTAERIGLAVTFVFDGSTWRAADVAAVTGDDTRWAVLPTPLPSADPCAGFRRDRAGSPFDQRSDQGRRAWCDAGGRGGVVVQPDQLSMLTRYPCRRGSIAMLAIGNPLGAPIDSLDRYEYLRDPQGVALDADWIDERWRPSAKLPADAASTGWTNGNIELWLSPSRVERGVYIRLGDAFEWWPRASPDGWGVTDCN